MDHGAKVMNLSFGGVAGISTITSAAQYVVNHGGLVVAAAGNCGCFDATAENPYMISVSATDSSDKLASFSSTGNYVDLAAPGVSIYTTTKRGGYGGVSGTSFSSPITVGVAALIWSVNPGLSPANVETLLEANADDLGPAGYDTSFGCGRVNAYKAVLAAGGVPLPSPDTTPPSASISSPADGVSVSGTISVDVSAADNVGVTQVAPYIDGALFATDPTAPYSFAWDTTQSSNTTHTLQAVAYDAAGNSGASAAVSVTSGPSPCVSANPTVALSPSGTQWVKTGTTVAYTVTVTNNDNSGCTAATFPLAATVSDAQGLVVSGWTLSFDSSTLTLNPGANATTTLRATSSATADGGFYTVAVTATHGTNLGSASVVEMCVTSLAIRVTFDKPTYPRNSWVIITTFVGWIDGATGKKVGTPGASVTLTIRKPTPDDGTSTVTLTTDANGNAVYSLKVKQKDPIGTWQVQATASKNAITGIGTGNFKVQ